MYINLNLEQQDQVLGNCEKAHYLGNCEKNRAKNVQCRPPGVDRKFMCTSGILANGQVGSQAERQGPWASCSNLSCFSPVVLTKLGLEISNSPLYHMEQNPQLAGKRTIV